MEGSESEKVFESLNLNPQLFINEVLNDADDITYDAFDYFHKQASSLLKIEGTDRSPDLYKAACYLRDITKSRLDEELKLWEDYCKEAIFVVPEGFSLPQDDEPSGVSELDLGVLGDPEVDAELDSLNQKLKLALKKRAKLNRELQELESRSLLSNSSAESLNEALESNSSAFQEFIKTASDFRDKMEKLKKQMIDETECKSTKRFQAPNGEVIGMIHDNGLLNAKLEDLQDYLKNIQAL